MDPPLTGTIPTELASLESLGMVSICLRASLQEAPLPLLTPCLFVSSSPTETLLLAGNAFDGTVAMSKLSLFLQPAKELCADHFSNVLFFLTFTVQRCPQKLAYLSI